MKAHESASAPMADGRMAASPPREGRLEPTEDLAHLLGLLEQGDVEEARALVKKLEKQWPNSERVRHYARVLAPPLASVRRGERGRSLAREHAWLREHAREYPGCWLAVFEGRLIAADPDLSAVLAVVRQTPGAARALLHFQPGAPE